MDPVRIDKFKAMKRYRQKRKQHLLLLLLVSPFRYLATILLLCLFLSCTLWLPHVSSGLKLFFFFGSLPDVVRVVSRPECLFILGNVIVIYLVGESKLSKTSPAVDIQEEYHRRKSNNIEWQESKEENYYTAVGEALAEEEEEGMEKEEEEEEEEEEEKGLSDEIDKKAEDFIARINRQRRLEERRLLSSYL